MKEQVLVDGKIINISTKDPVELFLNLPGHMQVKIEEWRRLKRLDENVKREIIMHKDKARHVYPNTAPKNQYDEIVELLESLDK